MDKKLLEEIKRCILNKDYIIDEMYIEYIMSEVIDRDLTEYIKKVEFNDKKIKIVIIYTIFLLLITR